MKRSGVVVLSRIAGVGAWIAALTSIGWFVWYYSSTSSFMRTAVRGEGVVVWVTDSFGASDTIAEFRDGTGGTHRVVSNWSSSPPSHSLGDKVDVFYQAEDPSRARIGEPRHLRMLLFCVPFALGPFVFGCVFFWVGPRIMARAGYA